MSKHKHTNEITQVLASTGIFNRHPLKVGKMTLLSSAIVSVLGLSACGGGGSDGGGSVGGGSGGGAPPTVSVDERIIVSMGDSVTLSATGSDPDGDAITYSWMQLNGDDVTNTSGFNSSAASFSAPDEVGSFTFQVTATANGASATDSIQVLVLENVDTAIFVDADFSGTSDGSIDAPYTELSAILDESLDNNQDLDFYIKTPSNDAVYNLWEDTPRNINENISFYGGFTDSWQRDSKGARTPVVTDQEFGLRYFNTSEYVEISGLDLQLNLEDIDQNDSPVAISANTLVSLTLRSNTIAVADHPGDNSSASVYGVVSDGVASFSLLSNTISTGSAPVGARDEVRNNTGNGANGANGSNADGKDGGSSGGDSAREPAAGGNGGDGGTGSNDSGDGGKNANTNPAGILGNAGAGGGSGENGDDGQNGRNAGAGNAGTGGNGFGRFTSGGRFATTSGIRGGNGFIGTGGSGGGGGGGGSSFLGFNGGGGGGGGEGGGGGQGGFSASSGGASIGVYITEGSLNDIFDNIITTANGGDGGIGGLGASGGNGGAGGSGASGNSNNSGDGGDGGNGGDGGDGGIGGSGGGGPSFGVLLNPNTFATISNNQITTGMGGDGGSAIIAIEQAAGRGGWSVGIFDADTNDASTPTLDGNTFTIGSAGNDGNPSSGTGTASEDNL
jgi:hypothetical protein